MRKAFLISTLTAVAAATAIFAGSGGAASPPLRGVFVGRVTGSQAFVAVAVGHGKARAYVCDSRRLGVWLPLGGLRGSYVDLARPGVRLTGSVGRSDADGTVTLAHGTRHAFHALLAPRSGAAGLYRARAEVNGNTYLGGWILLRGGAQRGNVVAFTPSRSTTIAVQQAPVLNPEAATVEVTEGSVATVVKLNDAIPLIPTTIQ